MNKIDTSQVNDPLVQQPFLATSLAFLQAATQEALNSLAIAMLGDSYSASLVYVLFGCVNTGSGSNFSITAGAVFFNGEVYTVPAVSGTLAGGNSLYSAVVVTNGAPDPTRFSDNSAHNVHNVRQWVIAQAASGSNAYTGWVYLSSVWQFVGTGAGTIAPFQNGWSNQGGGSTALRCRLIGLQRLMIEGDIVGGTASTIFTLPVGYRPVTNKTYRAIADSNSFVVITISTAGVVACDTGSVTIHLNGIIIALD